MEHSLDRFVQAQEEDYNTAYEELAQGRKRSHWIWYVFPQLKGLGQSHLSHLYGLDGLEEAGRYCAHPLLGRRLTDVTRLLLRHKGKNISAIMGSPDDLKLRSCMTLFAALPGASPIFQEVIDAFFNGEKDERTLEMIRAKSRKTHL